MIRQSQASELLVGDRVCYSRQFLQWIGCLTGDIPAMRGIIQRIEQCGPLTLATVRWSDGDTTRVLPRYLSRVTPKRGIEESV